MASSSSRAGIEAAGAEASQEFELSFDLNNGDYAQFIRDLRALLVEHESSEIVAGHPVLARQEDGKAPKRWIYIKLVGNQKDDKKDDQKDKKKDDQNETATLALRDDNLYLLGFKAGSGSWYEFSTICLPDCVKHKNKTQCGKEGSSVSMMEKDTIFLRCDVEYKDFLGVYSGKEKNKQVRDKIARLELCKRSAMEAVHILSEHPIEHGVVNPPTGEALVRLILMFCEATRMIPFFDTIRSNWGNATGSTIPSNRSVYIWQWGAMSGALQGWRAAEPKYTSWQPRGLARLTTRKSYIDLKDEPINLDSAGKALDVVQVLLKKREKCNDQQNSKGKEKQDQGSSGDRGGNDDQNEKQQKNQNEKTSENWKQKQAAGGNDDYIKQQLPTVVGFGRPLVQVFRVRACPGVIIGTIAVFDGKRGQIIYRWHNDQSQGMVGLALTGPCRGISADGSFLIQVDGTDASDESKKLRADLDWNCYSDHARYDEVFVKDITIGDRSIAEVTYAVLSCAVEATVQVHLKLEGDKATGTSACCVHGEITAYYCGESVLLFSRTEEKKMELGVLPASSSNGSIIIPVPLSRWVVAATLGSLVHITVKIHVACFPNHENAVPFGDDLFFSLVGHEKEKLVKNDVEVHVKITSPDMEELPDQSRTLLPTLTEIETSAALSDTSSTPAPSEPLHVPVHFDCRNDDYAAFIGKLRKMLVDHPDRATVHGRPVLAKQQTGEPVRWMEINLLGGMNETASVAVRVDVFCLVGFKGKNRSWYEFGFEGRDMRILPGSTFLGCNNSYKSILLDGQAKSLVTMSLVKVQLGKEFAMDAISKIWAYEQQVGQTLASDLATKWALARLMVMICDSARIEPICRTVANGWKHRSVITERHVDYIFNWIRMSSLLTGRLKRSDQFHLRNIGIMVKEDAANVVQLVHNPRQPLLEVFGVHVRGNSGVVNTVALVDEEGSKVVIYNHHEGQHGHPSLLQGIIDLPLTDHYRPVPAEGKIGIQVQKTIATTEDSKFVKANKLWDGPSDHAMYNKASVHTISLDDAGSTAVLSFAVLHDAVEKDLRVQLNFKDKRDWDSVACVYGEITVTNKHFHGKSVLVFSRTKEQPIYRQVTFTSDKLYSISIPLMRPSIAMPLDVPLDVKVMLFGSTQRSNITLKGFLFFDTNGAQTKMIRQHDVHAKVMLIPA